MGKQYQKPVPVADASPQGVASEAPDSKVAATVADVESGATLEPAPQDEPAEPVGESWAEPVPTEAERLAAREAWLMEGLAHLKREMDKVHVEIEAIARTAAVATDHVKHAKFAKLANVVAEFRNGLAL